MTQKELRITAPQGGYVAIDYRTSALLLPVRKRGWVIPYSHLARRKHRLVGAVNEGHFDKGYRRSRSDQAARRASGTDQRCSVPGWMEWSHHV